MQRRRDMTSFGIDFGTTNTRVAYYDGKTIRMVSLVQERINLGYQLPTLVRFHQGKPIAIGKSARKDEQPGQLVREPLKWLLQGRSHRDRRRLVSTRGHCRGFLCPAEVNGGEAVHGCLHDTYRPDDSGSLSAIGTRSFAGSL